MAKKKNMFGVNTYVKRTKPKIGRHKKRMNKDEKRSYKKYNRLGRLKNYLIAFLKLTLKSNWIKENNLVKT